MITLISFHAAGQGLEIFTEENAPLQFKDSGGNAEGFAVDIVKAIQTKVGNSDEIKVVPWARGYYALTTKDNVVLFSTSRTAERNSLFQWVGPITEARFILISKANSPVNLKSLADAKKLGSVGVVNNDVRDQILGRMGFSNLDRVDSFDTLLKKLFIDRNDVIAVSTLTLETQLKNLGHTLSEVKTQSELGKSQYWLAFSKKVPTETVQRWQKAFDQLKAEGSFEKIYRKWLGSYPLPGDAITSF